jgi:hypothetical protein
MSRWWVIETRSGTKLGMVDGEMYLDAFGHALDLIKERCGSVRPLRLELGEGEAPPALVRRCTCGAEYDASSWRQLPQVGIYADEIEQFELRNCSCRSTIGVHMAALP